jgi:hypothetical protein
MRHKLSHDPIARPALPAACRGRPVSVESTSWALNLAPVPGRQGRGGRRAGCRRGATGAVTGWSGCTRTVLGTVQGTVRRTRTRARGTVRSGRRRQRPSGPGVLRRARPALAADPAQRPRLTPAVLAALDEGWAPQRPADVAGSNPDGVRNPCAVLIARLSAAELPRPPGQQPPRPAWCGECDERTRTAGFYGDAPAPCRRCRPGGEPRRQARFVGVPDRPVPADGHRPTRPQDRARPGRADRHHPRR